MLPMPAATAIAQPAVLVVHANFAVGSAMAERLMDTSLVALVPARSAAAGLLCHGGFDVVVLCPYLTAGERADVVRACTAHDPQPAVLELRDEPEALDPHVRAVAVPASRRPAAQHVVTALSPHA
jgi:hypothetical protein